MLGPASGGQIQRAEGLKFGITNQYSKLHALRTKQNPADLMLS